MIEALAAALSREASATTGLSVKDGVRAMDVSEGKKGFGSSDAGRFGIGGDMASVFSALDVNPDEIAKEVRGEAVTQETRGDLPEMQADTRERLADAGYPEKVLEAIGSEAEARIYEKADLQPTEVNGKDALMRKDIDYGQKDALGSTNMERMRSGRAPLDASGAPIELHHIGQKQDSPLAELTNSEHRKNGNDNILHNKMKESEIDRGDFRYEKAEYWKARAAGMEER